MRIGVFGLGYVGCVSAACLAHEEQTTIGVDVNPREVKLLAAGRSPVIEPGLDDLIDEGVHCGRPLATSSSTDAVRDSEAWIICVGTSSGDDNNLDPKFVLNVCSDIGAVLATKHTYHVVIVRSTVLPGTVHERMNPTLEESSGKVAGLDFGVCMVPEFLREGCVAQDYYKPSTVVIDELDPRSGGLAQQLFQAAGIPLVRTTIESAEMTKCASNAFHRPEGCICQRGSESCQSSQHRWAGSDGYPLPGPMTQHIISIPQAEIYVWWFLPAERPASTAIPGHGTSHGL